MKKVPLLPKVGLFVIICLILAGFANRSAAQQNDYRILALRSDMPQVFVNVFTLPGDNPGSLKLTTTFNLSYNALAFRKLNNSSRGEEFFSTSEMSLELFRSPRTDLRPFEEVDIQGLESVGRATWRDTAFAASYEQTKSADRGLQGAMQVQVTPGHYTYLLQRGQEGDRPLPYPRLRSRRGDSGDSPGQRTRNIHVQASDRQPADQIFLGSAVDGETEPRRLTLINMGDNVPYGKDFYAMIPLPGYQANASYTLRINQIDIDRRDEDTTQVNEMVNEPLSKGSVLESIRPELQSSAHNIALELTNAENRGSAYALVKIPNSRFSNAVYRLAVLSDQSGRPVAQGVFRSYWSDIPTSLLSLDVAIDMLRFIADRETLDQIDSGSDRERERKFREFWDAKDPTPNTAFNELQAEYYRRIDYAFENYGSQNTLGFNSDRGRIYINYGPPQDVKRTFPTEGATTEVWTYPNRKFVFRATTGFGDFKLVQQ